MNYNELIEALKLIKDTCSIMCNCDECPFGKESKGCFIHDEYPVDWCIVEPKKTVVRLLR